jgi:hypothetical protein
MEMNGIYTAQHMTSAYLSGELISRKVPAERDNKNTQIIIDLYSPFSFCIVDDMRVLVMYNIALHSTTSVLFKLK